jgi:hypothetical protein
MRKGKQKIEKKETEKRKEITYLAEAQLAQPNTSPAQLTSSSSSSSRRSSSVELAPSPDAPLAVDRAKMRAAGKP